MSRFAIYCRDAAHAADKRKGATTDHLRHVEAHLDRYWVAGPLKNEDGETVGSLLIIEAENAEAALSFLHHDPYYEAGIWGNIWAEEFVAAAGEWVGGKNW